MAATACCGVVETGRCPVSDVRRGGCGDLSRRETPHRGVSTSLAAALPLLGR
jgi:hypothetical protein